MVIISNGDTTKKVSVGAYNSFYKPMGFEVIKTSKPKVEIIEEAIIKDVEPAKEETPKEENIVVEKPKTTDKRLQAKKK